MKKKILLISSMLLTFILVVFVSLNNTNNENKNVLSNTNKDTEVINSNMITMMYETDAGTGIYEETKDTTWPENGYIFNENLSGCERGGELEYNSINKTVNLLSNKSDNCYVYFDKYDGVWIDNVSISNVTGSSVTLDISATSENGNITTYYYSLNDSEEYQETTTNPITINDLNKLTEYKISIYAIDSTNARSNIYEVIVATTDESRPVINSVSVTDVSYNGFTLTVDATSDVEINKYYYILKNQEDNNAAYSTSNKYAFNNLKENTNYDLEIFIEDTNGIFSEKYNISEKTMLRLSTYIVNLYSSQGSNNIYYHASNLNNSAGDNSYRYSGANPNNYVCFGSTTTPCPTENIYRIIGVFNNQVKIITSDVVGNSVLGKQPDMTTPTSWYPNYSGHLTNLPVYFWSGSSSESNIWSSSTLNIDVLNGTYLTNLGIAWSNLIANHIWKVGGMSWPNGATSGAQTAYNYEVGANSSDTSYNAKVGLMYLSDYYYGASNTYWSYAGSNSSGADYSLAINDNWLYIGIIEHTIARNIDNQTEVYKISGSGSIVTSAGGVSLRPVFYLNSNVTYLSGDGSEQNPIRIGM